ncbi:ribosome biogenesis factor YjgA [Sphaerotilus natans]|uniref:ribosome biogenesis factor YjgA n=1 Tax=Sphaerotilus natans TaxID=34103 RepID=UPI00406D472F
MHPNYHFDHEPAGDELPDEDFSGRPSKTRLKQQMHDLQALGKELDEMPAHRLKAIVGMPESLLDALLDLKRIRSHEGRRRQLQYIGKIMRGIDAEPLREAVASFKLPGAKETLALHTAERWRDRLIAEDEAFTQWMGEHPGTDAQALRTLIRNARKDQAAAAAAAAQGAEAPTERKGRAYRELFQQIKATLAAAAAAAAPDDADDDQEDDDE